MSQLTSHRFGRYQPRAGLRCCTTPEATESLDFLIMLDVVFLLSHSAGSAVGILNLVLN